MGSHRRVEILGVQVHKVTKAEALEELSLMLDGNVCSQIVTPNAEIVDAASKNERLKAVINNARLVIPDGIGLVYASRFKHDAFEERVAGIDFCYSAFGLIAERGESAYILGAKPGIAETAAEKLKEQIPGLVIAGTHDGYFKEEDVPGLIEEINASGAKLLCVALGNPKQEYFIDENKMKLSNVRAAIGIGGSLDVWSGTLKRAPQFYQDHGLEWLYRFIQQPSRIGRIAALPLFLIKAAARR